MHGVISVTSRRDLILQIFFLIPVYGTLIPVYLETFWKFVCLDSCFTFHGPDSLNVFVIYFERN